MMTVYGASGMALLLGDSGTVPLYVGIGNGSAAITSTRSGLMCEVNRKEITSSDNTIIKEFTMTADWGSVDMSGLTITEFAVFSAGSPYLTEQAYLANPGFESSFTSGTNWFRMTGTNFFSGAQSTGYATSGTYSCLLNWFSGASSGFASGQYVYVSQKMNFSGLYQLQVDFKLQQYVEQFQGEIYCGSTMLGSIYTVGSAEISGTKIYELSTITPGSYDLKLQYAAISGTIPASGVYYMYFDNIKTMRYSGGTAWSVNGFAGIVFDGTNELQIQDTFRVTEG